MTYLVPLDVALPPLEDGIYPSFVIKGEARIPDDTYTLVEWYCPNPTCNCNEANLEIVATGQETIVGRVRVPLNFVLAPMISPEEMSTEYAPELVNLISEYMQNQPEYVKRLHEHYQLVKKIAEDPKHPAYASLTHWATTGTAPKPPGRKRHKRS